MARKVLVEMVKKEYMLQDPVTGLAITPFRPHVVEFTDFVDVQVSAKKMLKILGDVEEKYTDEAFSEEYKKEKDKKKVIQKYLGKGPSFSSDDDAGDKPNLGSAPTLTLSSMNK